LTLFVAQEVNVDTADSQHLSRISKMLLAGTGLAFAWVLLSFALGLSTPHAHAADDDGLLGTLTSTVDDTTTAATGVVEDTAVAAAETVAPVIKVVTATEPALPVAPVDEAVESTVSPVVAPVVAVVTDVTESGVVSPIVDSTLGVVDAVPVVGGVVTALGADDAVSAVGASVDGVLQGTTGAVIGTASAVVGATASDVPLPTVPPLAGLEGAATTTASTTADAAAGPLEMLARAAYLTGATAFLAIASDLPAALSSSDSAFVSGGAAGGIFSLLRAVMQADSALIGPGGAGPGAWVLVALGFVVAYRAWVRRTGLENDVAPAAPVLSTDVSPD
jgi:hypothetical protein